jgi:hypothetical protein
MDQDDPGKHITDPEQQLAAPKRGADRTPAQPPQQGERVAPGTGSGSRKPARIGAWIVGVLGGFCVFGGLFFGIELGVLHAVAYRLGTPTTATIDHCASHSSLHGDDETCYGTWGVGGKSNTGPIIGDYDRHGVGSRVDVHLFSRRDGSYAALTASEGRPNYLWTSGGVLAIGTGSVLMWSARRKIKTDSWPWSGR